ncbi:MAG TPA: nucleotidyltransferase [Clostridiales bacterium]|nr:nucleotidyltransferase [Clostridiales bacterium]
MKVLGIIAEYNPFHNGHLYHLMESKRIINPEYVIAIMSGNFTQRGEPALFDKWIRTEMVLKNGVDIVIELPTVYACQTAELFAQGGIQLLNYCNVVTHMSFGSEIGNIEPLYDIAKILIDEPIEYRHLLNLYLDKGLSYPSARNNALLELKDIYNMNISKCQLNKLLTSPNSILGLEYIKALINTNSSIIPISFPRKAVEYHDRNIVGNIASASAIREKLKTSRSLNPIQQFIPKLSFYILEKNISKDMGPVFIDNLEQLILGTLRRIPSEELASIMDVEEGLENRIKRYAAEVSSLEELLNKIKTRRYVLTRIQRILINMLLDITTHKVKLYNKAGGPQYIRILGFQKRALPLMQELKDKAMVPIITKSAHYQRENNTLLKDMFLTDVLATNIYRLGIPNPIYRSGGVDFKKPPVIIP